MDFLAQTPRKRFMTNLTKSSLNRLTAPLANQPTFLSWGPTLQRPSAVNNRPATTEALRMTQQFKKWDGNRATSLSRGRDHQTEHCSQLSA